MQAANSERFRGLRLEELETWSVARARNPERDRIPPRDRDDRQTWPGYCIYHNHDDSISFGTEEREYFLASGRNHPCRPRIRHQHHRLHGLPRAHRKGRKEAYSFLKQFVLEHVRVAC